MITGGAKMAEAPRVAMQVTRGIVVASVQTDLTEPVLKRFQNELLTLIHRVGAHGVVFDLSGLDLMDSVEFAGLCKILRAAELLGARGVLSGLGPGIVSSLIDADVDISGIEAAHQTDDAVALIRRAFEQRRQREQAAIEQPGQPLNEPLEAALAEAAFDQAAPGGPADGSASGNATSGGQIHGDQAGGGDESRDSHQYSH